MRWIVVLTALISAGSAAHPIEPDEVPLSDEATGLIRGMTLLLLPEVYSDDDNWGRTKRIQSGLNVELDGLRLDTSRRWKNVSHGTWRRVDATLIKPQEFFQLQLSRLSDNRTADRNSVLLPNSKSSLLPNDPAQRTDSALPTTPGVLLIPADASADGVTDTHRDISTQNADGGSASSAPRYRIRGSLRLFARGSQQQWNRGIKLYSVSADLVADIALTADVEFQTDIVEREGKTRLRVLPEILNARIQLTSFHVDRLAGLGGEAARAIGEAFESLVAQRVRKENARLAKRVNEKIRKRPEKFEVPAGFLGIFGTQKLSAAEPDAK